MIIRRTFSIVSTLRMACLALHCGAIMFDATISLLHLNFPHGIIAKGILNLLEGLTLNVTKLLAKCDAVSMLDVFGQLNIRELTRPTVAKMFTHAHEF